MSTTRRRHDRVRTPARRRTGQQARRRERWHEMNIDRRFGQHDVEHTVKVEQQMRRACARQLAVELGIGSVTTSPGEAPLPRETGG